MPIVKPISDLQRNMAEITQKCQSTKQPIYLTKNGSAALVVMDADAFDHEMALHRDVYDREARVFSAIMRGAEDEAAGRVRPLESALADAAKLRAASHV